MKVTRFCCFQNVHQKEQLVLHNFTTRTLVAGPRCCVIVFPWTKVEKKDMVELKLNQYALVICDIFPENNRYEFGPCVVRLRGPFEKVEKVGVCPVLDQDDYMVVCGADGIKRNFKGPGVFKPIFGDVWTESKNTIQIPVNYYLVVNDANDTDHPVHHVRGPLKFYPEPFQTITMNGNSEYYPCIEVTQTKAVILQKADGTVVLLDEPQFYMPLVGETVLRTIANNVQLKTNQYALIICDKNPENNRYEYGPGVVRLGGPFEKIETIGDCPVLGQDNYLVVFGRDGMKRNIRGPTVYKPTFGETWSDVKLTIAIPVNQYAVINDARNMERPIYHVRGPVKFYLEPFETLTMNGRLESFSCWEVSQNKGIHLQKADGSVLLLDQPQFYMPQVGEKLIKNVERTVLLLTDFCILKFADGRIRIMKGRKPDERSFFLEPFAEFLVFACDVPRTILSTLPTFMSHRFCIRSSDNVQLELDVRITFQIQDVDVFSANPVDFYPLLRNYIQNSMLSKFSQSSLREFMSTFAKIANGSVEDCSRYFNQFGIGVLDIQIINYSCTSSDTQKLLETDIHTNVTKQNELRMRQNDVLIQEQISEVTRRQKDLEVQMAMKDNEVALQKKQLDNSIRLKDMEISILEEHKRKELLEVRRGNDLVEAEFEGRSRGQLFNEFVRGVDESLSSEQKVAIYMRQMDFEQAKVLYGKVKNLTMYPPNADLKLFNINSGDETSHDSEASDMNTGSNSSKDHLTKGILYGIGAFDHK